MQDETSQPDALDLPDHVADGADVISGERLERILAFLEVQIAELDRREQQLNSELATLDSERRSFRWEVQQFEERVEGEDAALKQRAHDVADREAECQQLSDRLCEQQAQLEQDADQLESGQAELLQERSTWREESERDIAERRQALEQRETQIDRRTVDLEKRKRFHEEHLEKVRRELDQQQRELVAAAQQQQMQREQTESQIGRRLSQMRTYRALIEQLDLENRNRRDAAAQADRARVLELAEQFESLASRQARFNEQHAALNTELGQQADHLRTKELDLEQRSARLEAARGDLQRTQRECMDSQTAAEAAWSQLCEAVGADAAGERLEEQRRQADERFEAWKCDNADQLTELKQAAAELQKQRAAITDATASQLECLARREEAMRELERTVESAVGQLVELSRTIATDARQQDDDSRVSARELDNLETMLRTDRVDAGLESDAA